MTRTPQEIDAVLEHVGLHWKMHPDWRLEQLLHNAHQHDGVAFYIEDETLMRALDGMDHISFPELAR